MTASSARIPDEIRVIIYHEMRHPFRSFDNTSAIEEVYRYDMAFILSTASKRLPLEVVWDENQALDPESANRNIKHKRRSLSVGDVVGLVRADGASYHAVEPMGWRELTHDDVIEALSRGAHFDPFEGL